MRIKNITHIHTHTHTHTNIISMRVFRGFFVVVTFDGETFIKYVTFNEESKRAFVSTTFPPALSDNYWRKQHPQIWKRKHPAPLE